MTTDKHQIHNIAMLPFDKHWKTPVLWCNSALRKHRVISTLRCCSYLSHLALNAVAQTAASSDSPQMVATQASAEIITFTRPAICYVVFSFSFKCENSSFVLWTCKSLVLNKGNFSIFLHIKDWNTYIFLLGLFIQPLNSLLKLFGSSIKAEVVSAQHLYKLVFIVLL